MTAQIVSRRIAAIYAATPVLEFLTASPQARLLNEPGVANFLLGNPQQMFKSVRNPYTKRQCRQCRICGTTPREHGAASNV